MEAYAHGGGQKQDWVGRAEPALGAAGAVAARARRDLPLTLLRSARLGLMLQ